MSNNNFEHFSEECLERFMPMQEAFLDLYQINSYEHWFYDDSTGVFDFKSDDGRKLYFRYIYVGSFSTTTNTWKWAWDNSSMPLYIKQQLKKVKQFGEANRYQELTNGLIDGDEYTGWAMTAVSANLLNAIGGYRVPQEHLFIYFIFTNELTEEEYEKQKDKYIQCDMHDVGRVAFICQHLNKNTHIGFNEAFESDPFVEPDDDYQAWCDPCEKIRLKEDGWSEKAMEFAKIKLVCDQCYFEIKESNQKI